MDGDPTMEHYDWNDGWLFCPTFDPALVRPECTGLELESVRIPHTVKALPYNYCNENDHQRLCGYRREFFAPAEWAGRTVLLTFGAIAHDATVFCNGRRLFHHGCGYTAFTVDLTSALHLGKKNVVAVRCDSREDLNIPPFGGSIDYLTYGGIYRAVSLDIKEPAYLRDVFVEARAEGDFRIYTATVGETVGCTLQAEIRSPAGSRAVYRGELALPITGTLNGVHPWSIEHPTLYTLTVKLIRPGTSGLPDRVLDEKTVRFGFRTVQFVAGGLYLNGQRVVLRGINRHRSYAYQGYAMPDSLQRLDAQFIKKDLGCNAVRTSHYPYAEEFYDLCDREGILVMDETPAVGIGGGAAVNPYKEYPLAEHHRQVLAEMIHRDKNHPCVVLWSLGNEPDLEQFPQDAYDYWHPLYELAHQLDPQNRPVTLVCCQNDYTKDITTRTMDIVCINRYYGWYNLSGDMDAACYGLNQELDFWAEQHKPVMMSEYGADTVAGLHTAGAEMFSEEFQVEFYRRLDAEFDKRPWFVGEFVWNFADYDTVQGPMRVDGNKKGLFTRDRRPKLGMHFLRQRWAEIPTFGFKESS